MEIQDIDHNQNIDKLNEFNQTPKRVLSKKATLIVILTIIILSFINIYLMQIYSREGIRDLTGRVVSETDIIRAQFVTILFSIPLISFILRALVSFIPYTKNKYSQ